MSKNHCWELHPDLDLRTDVCYLLHHNGIWHPGLELHENLALRGRLHCLLCYRDKLSLVSLRLPISFELGKPNLTAPGRKATRILCASPGVDWFIA